MSGPTPDQALAESALWRWNRQYYERVGPEAWSSGTVPWRITNSVSLARLYAALIDAWARDVGADQVTVLEVGAGSGRLAFHLARALVSRGRLREYVLSDGSARNVEAWRTQPQLRQLEAAGCLRRCAWEVEQGAAPALQGPVVAVANYVFDSLPHSAWQVRGGRLLEGRVHLKGDDQAEGPQWDLVFGEPSVVPPFVRGYAAHVGEGTFGVPVGALGLLKALRPVAGLLLAADKGYATVDEVRRADGPQWARHGSLSAMVNFDALRAWCGWGGLLQPSEQARALKVVAIPLGGGAARLPLTRQVFSEQFEALSPLSVAQVVDGAVAESPPRLDELLRALACSGFDPDVLVRIAEPLRALAGQLDARQCSSLVGALEQVAQQHFDFGEPVDLDFELAAILHRAGQLTLAADAYARSLERRGAHPTTWFNLALCRLDLGQVSEGRGCLERVVALDPGHRRAREIWASLQERR